MEKEGEQKYKIMKENQDEMNRGRREVYDGRRNRGRKKHKNMKKKEKAMKESQDDKNRYRICTITEKETRKGQLKEIKYIYVSIKIHIEIPSPRSSDFPAAWVTLRLLLASIFACSFSL